MKRIDDLEITFDEPSHTYRISTGESLTSVTTVINQYFEKFDADVVIRRMMLSPNWPKSKYYGMSAVDIKQLWKDTADTGTRMHAGIETVIKASCDQIETGPKLNKDKLIEISNRIVNELHNVKSFLEDWPLSVPESMQLQQEFAQFSNFVQKESFDEYCFPELRVFSPELGIAGTIDLIMYNSAGKVRIYDWKRVGTMRLTGWSHMKEPFSHLKDCNIEHYKLQLNLYRHLFETNYTINGMIPEVVEMKLFVFHVDNPDYQCFEIARENNITLIRVE